MSRPGLPEEVMADAKRLVANGHSILNAARLLSIRYKRTITGYVLNYWLDDKFRERKRLTCRERRARVRSSDARGKNKT